MIYYDQETYGSKNENDFKSLNFEKLVSKSIETRVQKSKPGSDFYGNSTSSSLLHVYFFCILSKLVGNQCYQSSH